MHEEEKINFIETKIILACKTYLPVMVFNTASGKETTKDENKAHLQRKSLVLFFCANETK